MRYLLTGLFGLMTCFGQAQEAAKPGRYYFFLSANISVPPAPGQFSALQSDRQVCLVSYPMLSIAPLGEPLAGQVASFLRELREAFRSRPETELELVRELTGSRVNVHYAAPYETELMRTEEECADAVGSFMAGQAALYQKVRVPYEIFVLPKP